uniref:NADH-ubiquinone oxidoreductase chain 2 n=1 Tax=Zonosagitta nagae TaxID=648573 RepID=A0A0U1VZQ5_9BILA|nr:NADH dehydrogenase subunit 2 [Zonosagitta nagae]
MMIGVVVGTLVVMSSMSWPIAWLSLELNLMCFVPSLMNKESMKKPCMVYFIAQSVGSLTILTMGLMNEFSSTTQLLLMFSIILKMGMMPFHFWVPMVVPFLEKLSILIIQTWQKLAPITLMTFCLSLKTSVSLVNIMLGALFMMSMMTPVLVIIFSGMSTMGWIFQLKASLLWMFLMIYFIILIPVVKYMNSNSSNFSLSLLNAGGLPPFTGFMWKLKAICNVKMKMASAMLIGSGLALVSYSRMLLNQGFKLNEVSPLVLTTMMVGMV